MYSVSPSARNHALRCAMFRSDIFEAIRDFTRIDFVVLSDAAYKAYSASHPKHFMPAVSVRADINITSDGHHRLLIEGCYLPTKSYVALDFIEHKEAYARLWRKVMSVHNKSKGNLCQCAHGTWSLTGRLSYSTADR